MKTIEGVIVDGSSSELKSTTIGVPMTWTDSGNSAGVVGPGQLHCTVGNTVGRSTLARQLLLKRSPSGRRSQGWQRLAMHWLSAEQSSVTVQGLSGMHFPKLLQMLPAV